MKKLITGLVMVSALSSFAQDQPSQRKLTIENITYGYQMTIECVTNNCEYLSMKTDSGHNDGDNISSIIFKRSVMMQTLENRRAYTENFTNQDHYSLSKSTVKNIKTNVKEGYNGKAVSNSFLLVGASILDTAWVIPGEIVDGLSRLFVRHKDKVRHKKGAKRILNNFDSELELVKVKEKYYKQIQEYIHHIGTVLINSEDDGKPYLCDTNRSVSGSCDRSTWLSSSFYVSAVDEIDARARCQGYVNTSNYHQKLCGVKPVE